MTTLSLSKQTILCSPERDATSEPVLRQAGIEKAAGLIAGLGSDVDNIFLVLTAYALKQELNKRFSSELKANS